MDRPFAPGYEIPPDLLLRAYASGVFPMAESADDPEVFWVKPETRGIIPLDKFHVPRRLARSMRKNMFEVSFDTDFEAIITGCAEKSTGRKSTWINGPIRHAYQQLFERGNCHTVEARHDGELVGGLYGVTLGRGFFGESMFSRATDASKICLVHLIQRLIAREFVLLDTQFTTEHLKQFGAVDIPRKRYEGLLANALKGEAVFFP